MYRLGPAQHRRQRLVGNTDHVVQRLLVGVGGTGGLNVDPQLSAGRVLDSIPLIDDLAQHAPARPQLADLLEEIVVGGHVEGEPLAELVQGNASPALALFQVLDDIRHEHAQLLNGGDAVVPGVVGVHGYGVPPRRVLSAPLDEVRGQAEVGLRRRLVGQLHGAPGQHVVGRGPSHLVQGDAAPLGHGEIRRSQQSADPVRQESRAPLNRQVLEDGFHVFNGVDGYPGSGRCRGRP